MKLVISAPTGYNARELLLPLQEHLAADSSIAAVHVITPAAPWHEQFFPTFSDKFHWHVNPPTVEQTVMLFKTMAPTVIVTPTVGLDPNDTPLLRAGKQLNIPTVTFVASWDNVYKMERLRSQGFSGAEKGRAADYELPDYMAVWNQMNFDHVLKSFSPAITAERMTITGPPRFDYFAHTDRIPTREQLLHYLGFDPEPASAPLLHSATTELYPFAYIIKALYRAQQNHQLPEQTRLYASVHPGGDMQKHASYAQYGARVKYSFGRRENSPVPTFHYLPSDEEIYYLIALFKYTSVLINQSSTVAIESMAADVPVINVMYGQSFDWYRWRRSMVYRDFQQHYRYITEEGATTLVKNARQLIASVNRYLTDPTLEHEQRQKTLRKMITYTDGSSSRRLLDFVKQCAAS